MFIRAACVAVGAVVAVVACVSPAWADPDPVSAPPPLPNVNAYLPISPVGYSVMGGNWYAFAGPVGVTCVINKTSGGYGCSGALPGAPEGANLVSAGPVGPPSFASTGQPIFGAVGEVKALPPNTRLSFREISCGVDGAGVVERPFCDEMAGLLQHADLAISRAGAGSLSELAVCGTPAILVPFPQAADRHQDANAAAAAALGAAVIVWQHAPEEPALRQAIWRLLGARLAGAGGPDDGPAQAGEAGNDPLATLRAGMASLAVRDADRRLADLLVTLA